MKIVLFGAGASFGSVAAEPYTPPLGPDLFGKLEERGGKALNLPEEIRSIFKDDFEKGMQAYGLHANHNTMQFQRELAGYLAEFKPSDGNVYGTFLDEFGVNGIVYVSLNYDLLFELSAGQRNINVNYSAQKNQGMVNLLKIHGSSNFWPDMPVGQLDGLTISNCKVDVEAPIRPLSQASTLHRCRTEKGLAPAIAHYAEGKAVKVSPGYVNRQLDEWKECATKAKKIAIIGVKVHEVDDHIWDVIGQSKSKVWYVGFHADKPAFEEWKENHKKNNAFFIESNFEDCIGTLKSRFKRN